MPADLPPISEWSYSGPVSQIINLHYHGNLVEVKNSGDVFINWENIEATAADLQSDRWSLAYARMLLAARDKTWKALPDKP